MNDFAQHYDDSGIEEWLDIGGAPESGGAGEGWGVDEGAYTTSISMSGLSREQIAHAERIAREIETEQRRGLDRFQGRRQQKASAQGGGQEDQIESAEDALELWRRKKQEEEQAASLPQPPRQQAPPGVQYQQQYQQQQRAPPGMQQYAPAPAPSAQPWDRNKEKKALQYLAAQLGYCTGNVNKYGNPTPLQAKNLLLKFGKDLLTCLPYPPPDIRGAVLGYFQQVGWDVRSSRPCPGSKPPNGTQIVGLVHTLTKYFCGRTGQTPPPMPILTIPQSRAPPPQQRKPVTRAPQTISHATQSQRGGYGKGKGGYQYQNNRQQGQYQNRQQQGGYQNRSTQNQGGKGNSYQQNRNYQSANRQNNYGGNRNNSTNNRNQTSNDGFTTVGGNRRTVNHAVNHSGGGGGQNQRQQGGRRY